MPRNLRANVELGVQIVVAIAVVVIAGVVVKRYLFPQQENRENLQQRELQIIGTRMNIPNVDWEQNKKTLVFFLKKDCAYCKYTAPFYRQLIEDASKRNVKMLAILPNSVEEGREYVESLDLPIENVQTGLPSSYKIPGVPSVLFVDNQGIIKGVWIGAGPGREKEVREDLNSLFDAKVSY